MELTNARWQLQCQRKRHLKIYLCFLLLRNYLKSLLINVYTNDKLPRIQIGRRGVQGKKENEKFTVLCSRSLQNLDFGHFTTFFFYRTQQRNVPKLTTHVQSDCFCSLSLLFCGVVVAIAVRKVPNNVAHRTFKLTR